MLFEFLVNMNHENSDYIFYTVNKEKLLTHLRGRGNMNFEKLLTVEWQDLAFGIVGSTAVMLFLNFYTLL